jgi:tRNA pseudouridine-54 N-methylase
MTEQKQFCEEHNSLTRHAEFISASPLRLHKHHAILNIFQSRFGRC